VGGRFWGVKEGEGRGRGSIGHDGNVLDDDRVMLREVFIGSADGKGIFLVIFLYEFICI
jgi:hypothetical protein